MTEKHSRAGGDGNRAADGQDDQRADARATDDTGIDDRRVGEQGISDRGIGDQVTPTASRSVTPTDLDALFEVLADEDRRQVLSRLVDGDDVAQVDELVDRIVAASPDASAADRERVAVRLYHAHLPKLADAGLVEYDVRSRTVRYRGDPVVADWLTMTGYLDAGN